MTDTSAYISALNKIFFERNFCPLRHVLTYRILIFSACENCSFFTEIL
jgi:hypothetical protein